MNQYPEQQPQDPYSQYPAQQPPQNPYAQPQQAYPMKMNQRPRPRKRGCLISAMVTVVVVIAIIAVAAAASNGKTNNTGTLSNASANSNASSSTSNRTFKVGDVVTVGTDWQVTVNSVKADAGDDFDQPKAGDTFLEVSVTLKNISSQEQDTSSIISWSLKDSTGQQYNETIVTNAPGTPDGKIEAGDKLTGTLSYEVPLSQKLFTLSFVSDFTSSGQTIWDLQI